MRLDGLQVGQGLAGVELVGERIDHGHGRGRRHRVDALLPGGPPGDGRHLPGQHPGHVLDGLAPADVGGLAVDHERVAAEFGYADGEGHPGP